MIIRLKPDVTPEVIKTLAEKYRAIWVDGKQNLLVLPSKIKSADAALQQVAEKVIVTDSDIQLASREFMPGRREIQLGDLRFGGDSRNTLMIAGPCSVESEEQIEQAAQLCVSLGIRVLRAGCFKPRTSPYTFQGLGIEGLRLLAQMREKYGLRIITEVRDSTHVREVIEYTDIIQIGAKAMYDHGILRQCGKADKPVLLKRGFGTTLQEFVQAAEFILSGGNSQVILCERGIRTFETKTRFTLDLCGVEWLRQYTNLPVALDPSHAMGYRYGVPGLARACVAMGVDALLIETHPNPDAALSDAEQQLSFEEFQSLLPALKRVAESVGYRLV
ncbi:MAG: 3-deoxy-7-phosphoheptulonate synthase [Chitinophagales bacterium]|nr:3-deoxy-7-phosphoheptulonate synthase [Chitinophagales bacterium]MDW8418910.1 3-deoxy-7-phosphoheptulonate synthase [Chitinophagales bacterium]